MQPSPGYSALRRPCLQYASYSYGPEFLMSNHYQFSYKAGAEMTEGATAEEWSDGTEIEKAETEEEWENY